MKQTSRPLWAYYFARKFSASRFEIVIRVFLSSYYKRHFDAYLSENLVIPLGKNHAIHHVKENWDIFANRVYQGVCGDFEIFKRYIQSIKRTQVSSLKKARWIISQPLKKLSWLKLGNLWQKWDKAHFEHFLRPIWIPFIIEPLLARDAEKVIRGATKKMKLEKNFNAILDTVFSPDKPNAITQERIGLLELVIKYKAGELKNSKFKKAFREHVAQYNFIPCYDVVDKPWDEEYFREEMQKLLNLTPVKLSQELKELQKKFSQNRKKFQNLLKTLKLTSREKDILKMAHIIVFIKDERDDYRRRQSFTIQPLFAELARRFNLPFRASLYMTKREMENWFKTKNLPVALSILEERIKGYCLYRVNNDKLIHILSGKEMKYFLSRQHFENQKKTLELKGIIGNRGRAQGRVSMVFTKHDLRKVKREDVLVSVTTNPDYVPTMRKCKAFVTDEGGLTCHAAIVARELNIPCIVGTKIATKVLKDGDLVEVDADKGVVRILK